MCIAYAAIYIKVSCIVSLDVRSAGHDYSQMLSAKVATSTRISHLEEGGDIQRMTHNYVVYTLYTCNVYDIIITGFILGS